MKKRLELLVSILTLCLMTFVCRQASKNDMTYRPLGHTGLQVSVLSIGCGGCMSRCPFGVDIPGKMDRNKELSDK